MARTKTFKPSTTIKFATSNRSNAKIKVKTFRNRTIDEILDPDSKLPGVPHSAVFLEMGVGEIYKTKIKA
jgi:hypothetical protein